MKITTGHTAVITGAASGIGLALTRAFTRRGARVLMADVEEVALEGAAAQLRASGAYVESVACDVSSAGAVECLANAAFARLGRVDVLVNNAGVGGSLGPTWDTDPDDWAWTFGVNVFGVVNGVRAFVPRMLASGGHVVNVASLAGVTSPPFLTPYVASKHAVVGLSESLAIELQAMGSPLKVSVICPGVVQSRIAESERNRPTQYRGSSRTPPEILARIRAAFAEHLANPMAGDDFAELVVQGIENDTFLILTHADSLQHVLQRAASLEQAARTACAA